MTGKKSRVTPTQRSLKWLRKQGYLCAITERWNPFAGIRQDLFGFVDIVGVSASAANFTSVPITSFVPRDAEFHPIGMAPTHAMVAGYQLLLVQTTSAANVSARIAKIKAQPAYERLRLVPGVKIVVHGWSKRGARGQPKKWAIKEEWL